MLSSPQHDVAAGAGLDEEFVQLSKVIERLSTPGGDVVTWQTLFALERELVGLSKRILTKGMTPCHYLVVPADARLSVRWGWCK